MPEILFIYMPDIWLDLLEIFLRLGLDMLDIFACVKPEDILKYSWDMAWYMPEIYAWDVHKI